VNATNREVHRSDGHANPEYHASQGSFGRAFAEGEHEPAHHLQLERPTKTEHIRGSETLSQACTHLCSPKPPSAVEL